MMRCMTKEEVLAIIGRTGSPLKKQLLTAALITMLLEQKGKSAPVVIGGCALSYYSREVYFTADIDFAYADRKGLGEVLKEIGFTAQGRYWTHEGLQLVVEAPASSLHGEDSPVEVVEFEGGLRCHVIGLEDLFIDRLNACRHWQSEADCEMVELLAVKYDSELDWDYLEKRAAEPENDTVEKLMEIKRRADIEN